MGSTKPQKKETVVVPLSMNKDLEKTAALYVRWSQTERSDENRGDQNMSLAAQKAEAEKFAQSLGLNVVKIYSEPLGTSVSRFSDKQTKIFDQALEDMGEVYHTLVIDEATRFNRRGVLDKSLRVVTTLNRIVEAGGRMVSRDGMLDTDTLGDMGGRLKLIIGMEFAAEESEKLSFRVKRGKAELARRNLWTGGKPPYGLKVVKYEDRPNDLERVDEECEVAVRIFDMFLAGASGTEIAQVLNDEGTFSQQGARWTPSNLARLVRRKHWIGHRSHGDDVTRDENGEPFMCQWGQIIDPQKFYAVDQILSARAKHSGGGIRKRGVYLLSGLVKCECGSKMHTTTRKPNPAQRVKNHAKYVRCHACKPNHTTDGYQVEDIIVTQALSHLAQQDPDSNMVTEVARQWLHKHSVNSIRAQGILENEAASLQARIKELEDRYFVEQQIDKERFEDMSTTLQGKLAAVEAELVTSGVVEELDVTPLFDLLQSSDGESITGEGSAWSELPLYEQRVILACIVDSVLIVKMEGCGIRDKLTERISITFNDDEICIEQATRADKHKSVLVDA
jgi:DNA invertase Pin-like site-specific DNA recombinase